MRLKIICLISILNTLACLIVVTEHFSTRQSQETFLKIVPSVLDMEFQVNNKIVYLLVGFTLIFKIFFKTKPLFRTPYIL